MTKKKIFFFRFLDFRVGARVVRAKPSDRAQTTELRVRQPSHAESSGQRKTKNRKKDKKNLSFLCLRVAL
jgi:hypothetical protein